MSPIRGFSERGLPWPSRLPCGALVLEGLANGGGAGHLGLFAFPLWLLAATVLFSVAVSVLAGVYPARRASRTDPIQALRRE